MIGFYHLSHTNSSTPTLPRALGRSRSLAADLTYNNYTDTARAGHHHHRSVGRLVCPCGSRAVAATTLLVDEHRYTRPPPRHTEFRGQCHARTDRSALARTLEIVVVAAVCSPFCAVVVILYSTARFPRLPTTTGCGCWLIRRLAG